MKPTITYALVGHGKPVLLLHGLGGDRHQSLGLLSDDFPATRIAPEMPGHGLTDLVGDEPVSFAAFASLVADLLVTLVHERRRPPGPVPVIGVSMGAGIATTLAASRPDLVERLILIRPSWLDESPPPNLAPFLLVAQLLNTLGTVVGRAEFCATAEYRSIEQAAPAMASSLLGQFDRADAVERSRVLSDMPRSLPLDTRDAYRLLDVETLVVVAPDDPVHPEQAGRTLINWIPHARLVTVPRKMADPTEHQLAVQKVVAAELLSG